MSDGETTMQLDCAFYHSPPAAGAYLPMDNPVVVLSMKADPDGGLVTYIVATHLPETGETVSNLNEVGNYLTGIGDMLRLRALELG